MSDLDAIAKALPTSDDMGEASAAILHLKEMTKRPCLTKDDRETVVIILKFIDQVMKANVVMTSYIVEINGGSL